MRSRCAIATVKRPENHERNARKHQSRTNRRPHSYELLSLWIVSVAPIKAPAPHMIPPVRATDPMNLAPKNQYAGASTRT
jgi:hypothetical protein